MTHTMRSTSATTRVALGSAVALVALTLGCTSTSRLPAPDPQVPVWMAGDSLSWGTAQEMRPRPYSVATGGAGFTQYAFGSILHNVETAIAQYGRPETLLVMGGVSDTPRATTEESLAGMEEFKAAMAALGLRLIWVAEPGFSYEAQLEPLSEWMLDQPESIDCREHKGWSIDGVHPESYVGMAACVDAALVDLGVEFTLPPP